MPPTTRRGTMERLSVHRMEEATIWRWRMGGTPLSLPPTPKASGGRPVGVVDGCDPLKAPTHAQACGQKGTWAARTTRRLESDVYFDDKGPGPIERAIMDGDEREATYQALLKTARLLDECESDRDARPLATTMEELTDKLKALDAEAATKTKRKDSVLAQVAAQYRRTVNE